MGRSLAEPRQRTVNKITTPITLSLLGLIPLSQPAGPRFPAAPFVCQPRAGGPEYNGLESLATDALRGAGDELDRPIDSFNRMTARLARSFEQIRRFSTDVSHELRTPLTAIRGQLRWRCSLRKRRNSIAKPW